MFYPAGGVPEDAATGSAAGPLAVAPGGKFLLVGNRAGGTHVFAIAGDQGVLLALPEVNVNDQGVQALLAAP